MLADPSTKSVRFASASQGWPYVLRRGSSIKESHSIWRATKTTRSYRGEGTIPYQSGEKNFWLDAEVDGNVVCAVFAEDRYWQDEGLGILDGAVTNARGYAYGGDCAHCGANTWGYRPCEKCGDAPCRSCRKCGCGAPQARSGTTCLRCGLIKAKTQFAKDSEICVDCN